MPGTCPVFTNSGQLRLLFTQPKSETLSWLPRQHLFFSSTDSSFTAPLLVCIYRCLILQLNLPIIKNSTHTHPLLRCWQQQSLTDAYPDANTGITTQHLCPCWHSLCFTNTTHLFLSDWQFSIKTLSDCSQRVRSLKCAFSILQL